jgi:hypothetical protein
MVGGPGLARGRRRDLNAVLLVAPRWPALYHVQPPAVAPAPASCRLFADVILTSRSSLVEAFADSLGLLWEMADGRLIVGGPSPP